jgi:uridine kinase
VSSAPSRSSVAALTLAEIAEVLGAAIADADLPLTVLIDGRSGAGKSTLARLLAAAWPHAGGAAVVALDDIYPGWEGLRAGAEAVASQLLEPRAMGGIGRWQRWDWQTARAAEWHEVASDASVIVEGCGVLTPRSAPTAAVRVWLDAPLEVRRERALARDGEAYAPHWDTWAAQDEDHVRRDDPSRWATHRFTVV